MFYTIIPQAKLPRNMLGMFTYRGEDSCAAGDVVIVEFRKRKTLGLVVKEGTPPHQNFGCGGKGKIVASAIKPIQEKIARAPSHLLPLIQWMADYYIVSPSFTWDALSPSPVRRKNSSLISYTIPFFGTQNARSHSSTAPPKNLDSSHTPLTNTYRYDTETKYADYIKLISDIGGKGACALFLAPTIADVTAFVQFLPAAFHERTILFTSELYKSKQKYWHAWERVLKTSSPLLVVGTRSAAFAPIHKLGLIIIDKAESDDYKQYDQNPRYDARTVAQKIAALTGCTVKMFSDGVVI